MTCVLVTGGSGRLGRAVLDRLAAAGHEVRAASRTGRRGAVDDPAGDAVSRVREPGVREPGVHRDGAARRPGGRPGGAGAAGGRA
ncbi:NAD-dependent epimerase/dehydratase family protein [Nonomuraea muscovyensis]|uniref:NAD-dependent epimerase/dehydratase family protein n=1 Tax=Nonomuraea muscovyensis TaxID=1124761 RepID=UPI0035E46266